MSPNPLKPDGLSEGAQGLQITQGAKPKGPEWRQVGALGRTSRMDPTTWGRAMGRQALDLSAVEVRLCDGPFGSLEAWARVPVPCECPEWALYRNGRGCHAYPCPRADPADP